LKTNERAKVIWRFKSRPEFLTTGSRLIFREGSTKGMGEVVKIEMAETNGAIKKDNSPNGNPAAKKLKASTNLSPDSKSKKKKAMTQENNNTQS
jgi:hypothetical protein